MEVLHPALLSTLEDSCLLPALASYLANDSGMDILYICMPHPFNYFHDFPTVVLDISKHTQLYKSIMLLISAITSNPLTRPLLLLDTYNEMGVVGGEETNTLQSLMKKLNNVAQIYSKTIGLANLALIVVFSQQSVSSYLSLLFIVSLFCSTVRRVVMIAVSRLKELNQNLSPFPM